MVQVNRFSLDGLVWTQFISTGNGKQVTTPWFLAKDAEHQSRKEIRLHFQTPQQMQFLIGKSFTPVDISAVSTKEIANHCFLMFPLV